MIQEKDRAFILNTAQTTYAFCVMPTGQLEHLYYGRRIDLSQGVVPLVEKHEFAPGNTVIYNQEHPQYSLEDACLEMSSYGKGDVREPFIEVRHADGSATSDFVFDSFSICQGKEEMKSGLPGSYDEKDEVEHLTVVLRDAYYGLVLELHYYVYEKADVITRRTVLHNESDDEIYLERLMSLQLDFDTPDYVFTCFRGAWAREMQRNDIPVSAGKIVNASFTGTSSSHGNPFVMLAKENTTEDYGDCYGCNLIYSGNHYEAAEVNGYGKTRFVAGINPQGFLYRVAAGESFEAPEAVLSYSHEGYRGLSLHMQHFVKEHIVRGHWKNRIRPVLLNSWEAAYFDINEKKLLQLAKAGKDIGIELFVMDDGWFGSRDDDTQSLGDWEVNEKKLPGGLSGLSKKIRALGMEFGLWVEPEMVNVNSRLYREHPEWVMQIPNKPHSEGRNQRILDLSQKEVQDYIIEAMTEVFSAAELSYVKWDMNRNFSDIFSQALPASAQGEVAHRYVLGLYRCMRELTTRFPEILFEGCASGGNRFDLGILSFFPQIWASDNTDAVCRLDMQNSYSYGYPMSTIGAHVSASPNHQTLRVTPLDTRFHVACFGVLGYECNLCDMKREDLEKMKEQITLYKKWREVLQHGDFYRETHGNLIEWTCVSPDRKRAVGFLMQKLVVPNFQYAYYKPKGLEEDALYQFSNRPLEHNIKEFGDLVNTVAPIHVKQDSFVHNTLAKFVKMPGESESYLVKGDALMYGGVKLKPAYGGTGYNEEVRHFQDFSSRLYFMEKMDSVH